LTGEQATQVSESSPYSCNVFNEFSNKISATSSNLTAQKENRIFAI